MGWLCLWAAPACFVILAVSHFIRKTHASKD
jgi:hypothetical protein